MTWGEIQIESIKKMFLNNEELYVANLETIKQNKKYKTYLYAMPQACNEAIRYISSTLGTTLEKYSLTKTNINDSYDLSTLINNYKKIKSVNLPNGASWKMITNKIIEIDDWYSGDIDIYYEIKPTNVDSTTASNTKLGIDDDYSIIIPLYIAAELYKDDDLSMSTMYMNEFMNMLSIFQNSNKYISNPTINSIYTM